MSEDKKNEMSEEKKLPRVTVTVEADGEVNTYEGIACAVTVADHDGTEGYTGGNVSVSEALDMISCLGRHIGHLASVKNLPSGVAEAMAADGIKRQMKKDSFSDLLIHLDAALGPCEECPDFEPKES